MNSIKLLSTLLILGLLITSACSGSEEEKDAQGTAATEATADPGDWTTNKGIGPVSTISFAAEIDQPLADKGQSIFTAKCSACHKPNKRYIGPEMAGIFDRRTPEWTANMIMNPMEMVQKDPIAKELLMEYNGTPMANQNLTQEETRAVLEYFRTLKSE
ncbi:MAG: cytochrome c [bacterium]|nr:cytochrome c [bacterium]